MASQRSRFTAAMAAVRRQMPGLVVLSCLVNLLMLVTSIYMLQIYDRVLSSGSLDTLIWLTAIALFAIALYGVLEQARRIVLSRTAGWIDGELNAPALRHAMRSRLAGLEGEAGIRDVSDLRNFYAGDPILAFLDMPWSVIFIAFIWLLHPVLGWVAILGAAGLMACAIANDLLTRARQRETSAEARAVQEAAVRFVDSGETISPLGMAGTLFEDWRKRWAAIRTDQQDLADTTTTILSFSRSLRLALQVVILGAGAYLVLAGQVTPGAMIAASIILGRALAPIERATAAWRALVAARAARRKLSDLFAGTADFAPPVILPRPKGLLTVEEVHYAPPRATRPILRDISFSVEPGEACAVLGPSGSGKSSLCRLLVGAWRPSAGCVRLDGADVFAWEAEDLGRHVGYLPQKVDLFPGTVGQNVARFGKIDNAALIAAARLAGVHDLVLRLPRGYGTEVGAGGEKLSIGQRQRIGLARALYGDPAFLVLDEPNSNLDEEGDHALHEALAELKQRGRTVVIVTHRTSVLKAVDRILVLRDGAVAGFGPRDQILRPVAQPAQPQPAQPRPVPAPEPVTAVAAE